MSKNIIKAIALGGAIHLIVLFSLVALEPHVVDAIEDQFTITQTVTSEISFLTQASDVVMNGTIAGVTGGTSNGGTQVVVLTNDASGYTMTIKASSSPAMQGNSQGGSINDYTPATGGVPDYAFSVPSGYEFGYTVSASTTADLAQKFKDDGAACNTGTNDTSGFASCWYGLSTVATSTIVRTTATPASGATTTLFFRVTINPNSGLAEDTYTATSTLTVTSN